MLKEFLKKNWYLYLLGVLALISVDTLQMFIPRFVGRIVDSLNSPVINMDYVKVATGWIVGIALGMFGLRFLWRLFIIGTARQFEYRTRNLLFEKLMNLTPGFFDKYRSGDLMARFTNDLQAVRMALSRGVVMTVDAIFMAIMTVIFMGNTVSWRLTWLAMIPLPFLAFVSFFFGRMIHNRYTSVRRSFSSLSEFVEENVSGVKIVKSFSANDRIREHFQQRASDYFQKSMSLIRIFGVFFPLVTFLSGMSQFIALRFGGAMVISNTVSLGEFIAFTSYLGMLSWPMLAFGWVVNTVQSGRASYKRLKEIFDAEPQVIEPKLPVVIDKVDTIEIKDLSYSYPNTEREVLKDISLTIKRGQMVGIIGTVGSGKSTLVKLMAKLYPVERGKIFVNGIDINDIHSKTMRELVAYVPQESFLFSDEVQKNIAFAQEQFSFEEVLRHAKLASVHDDIEKFSKGYKTVVGERGVTLSGGQRQRVTIARALMKNADICVFDDCLSAVDPETEEKIISTLREELGKKTMVIITHRLKVLRNADTIYVFDKGRIVQFGSHEELVRSGGLYNRMYQKQMIEEELENES